MTLTVGAFEAKTKLSELLDKVEHGERVIITKRGKPVAMIGPLPEPEAPEEPIDLDRLRSIADRFVEHFGRPFRSTDIDEMLYDEAWPAQMIVDTSAIMAILLKEEDAEVYLAALQSAPSRRMSGVSLVELTIVADRKDNPVPIGLIEEFIRDARNLRRGDRHAPDRCGAQRPISRFGRGRHAARLNLGDCFVYALAKETGEPLLFKGNDFAHTDITPAV